MSLQTCSGRRFRKQRLKIERKETADENKLEATLLASFGDFEVKRAVAIPQKNLILLSGVPATGKSTFGRYLARERRFAHYKHIRQDGNQQHAKRLATHV